MTLFAIIPITTALIFPLVLIMSVPFQKVHARSRAKFVDEAPFTLASTLQQNKALNVTAAIPAMVILPGLERK